MKKKAELDDGSIPQLAGLAEPAFGYREKRGEQILLRGKQPSLPQRARFRLGLAFEVNKGEHVTLGGPFFNNQIEQANSLPIRRNAVSSMCKGQTVPRLTFANGKMACNDIFNMTSCVDSKYTARQVKRSNHIKKVIQRP